MADQRNSQTKWGTRIFSEKSAFQRLPFEVYIRRLSRHHYGKNNHVLYRQNILRSTNPETPKTGSLLVLLGAK